MKDISTCNSLPFVLHPGYDGHLNLPRLLFCPISHPIGTKHTADTDLLSILKIYAGWFSFFCWCRCSAAWAFIGFPIETKHTASPIGHTFPNAASIPMGTEAACFPFIMKKTARHSQEKCLAVFFAALRRGGLFTKWMLRRKCLLCFRLLQNCGFFAKGKLHFFNLSTIFWAISL